MAIREGSCDTRPPYTFLTLLSKYLVPVQIQKRVTWSN